MQSALHQQNENYFAISNFSVLNQKLNQFTSKTCSEPLLISSNSTITIEISKNNYKFLKDDIVKIDNKNLLTVTLLNGNVKLFYLFSKRNPKDSEDLIDYEKTSSTADSSTWPSTKSYFQRSSMTTTIRKNGGITLIIDKSDTNVNFIYIGIKGLEEDNGFQLKVDDYAEVYCITSKVSTMKLNIIIAIAYVIFLL